MAQFIIVSYKDGTRATGEEISHYPSAVIEADSLATQNDVNRVEIVDTEGNVRYSVEGAWN